MTNSKDKLLDYMFAQNSKLTDQLAGVSEELRLQREQADKHHKDLKSSLAKMEERAVAAEKRADMEAQARANAEEQITELMKTIRRIPQVLRVKSYDQVSTSKMTMDIDKNCSLIINNLSLIIEARLSVDKYQIFVNKKLD